MTTPEPTPINSGVPGAASPTLVTPEMATRWLQANTHNRNLRQRLVDSYARDMAAGRWELNGEGVKFAPDGTLLDGQHRLTAIVKAGVPVMMYVFRNIPAVAQGSMDQGAVRKAGDILGLLDNQTNASSLAAAARLAIMLESGTLANQANMKVSTPEIREFVQNNPDLVSAVERALAMRNHVDIAPAVLSVIVWTLRKVDLEDAERFLWHWSTMSGLESGSPILALHARLREIKRSTRRVTRAEFYAVVIRAWNHWRRGNEISGLPLRANNSGPVEIPEAR